MDVHIFVEFVKVFQSVEAYDVAEAVFEIHGHYFIEDAGLLAEYFFHQYGYLASLE
jgi:hypothetical protein